MVPVEKNMLNFYLFYVSQRDLRQKTHLKIFSGKLNMIGIVPFSFKNLSFIN